MIYGTYGIFRGGGVTVDAGHGTLAVEAAFVQASGGQLLAIGARPVRVRFGQSAMGFTISKPSDLEPPVYDLSIAAGAGNATLIVDPAGNREINVVSQPATGQVVYGRVSWPAGASRMDQLVLDFDTRTVSRTMVAGDPLGVADLYAPGMAFGDVDFNAPLIADRLLADAQHIRANPNAIDRDFISLRVDQIQGAGDQLTVPPVRATSWRIEPGTRRPRVHVLDTQVPSTLTVDLAPYRGGKIYLLLHPTTGVLTAAPQIDTGQIVVVLAVVNRDSTLASLKWLPAAVENVTEQQARANLTFLRLGPALAQPGYLFETTVTWPQPFLPGPISTTLEIDSARSNAFPPGVLHVTSTHLGARVWTTEDELVAALGTTAFDTGETFRMWQDSFILTSRPRTTPHERPVLTWDQANRKLTWTMPEDLTTYELLKDGAFYRYGRIAARPLPIADEVKGAFTGKVTFSDESVMESVVVDVDDAYPLVAPLDVAFDERSRELSWHGNPRRTPNLDMGPGATSYEVEFTPLGSTTPQTWTVLSEEAFPNHVHFTMPILIDAVGTVRLRAHNQYGFGPWGAPVGVSAGWPFFADGTVAADGTVTAGGRLVAGS